MGNRGAIAYQCRDMRAVYRGGCRGRDYGSSHGVDERVLDNENARHKHASHHFLGRSGKRDGAMLEVFSACKRCDAAQGSRLLRAPMDDANDIGKRNRRTVLRAAVKRGVGRNQRHVWKGAPEPEMKEYGRCTKCRIRRRVDSDRCPNCGGTEYKDAALFYVAFTIDEKG